MAAGCLAWFVLEDPAEEADVVRLVSQPYVVEVLDALSDRPMTRERLLRLLRVRRSSLAAALRALAAHGAVRRRDRHGSWDGRDGASTVYELTDIGHRLIELLKRVDVWDALYERYLRRNRPS